jgi:SNF2 family DNA or RNA helicase
MEFVEVDQLTADSPRAPHPPRCGVALKPHQLAALHRMTEFESGRVQLASFASMFRPETVDAADVMETSIGILGDLVGSGKSFVVLALIAMDAFAPDRVFIPNTRRSYTVMGKSRVIVRQRRSADPGSVTRCTLLVSPHSICAQWEAYAAEFSTDLRYVVINRAKQLTSIRLRETAECNHLIIVTSTFYNQLSARAHAEGIRFKRVVIDEADSIGISSCVETPAEFTWLVTASYNNLLYPRGLVRSINGTHVHVADGLRFNGFIRNVCCDVFHSRLKALLVVKNNADFVLESVRLPPMVHHVVRCRTPASISALHGVVEHSVIEMINAGDMRGAIACIDQNKRGTHESIIQICIANYDTNITRLQSRLDVVEQLRDLSGNDEDADAMRMINNEIARVETLIGEYRRKVACIRDRLKQQNVCHICLENVENQSVVQCCLVSFCFKCILQWVHLQHTCPLCKKRMTTDDLMVVEETPSDNERRLRDEGYSSDRMTRACNTKMENLVAIVQNAPAQSRFIVFSTYDTTFGSVAQVLDAHHISHSHLKGNAAHINACMRSFKDGATRVLLVNGRNYGAGQNIAFATDVIMFHKLDSEISSQVIGRAQRLGRTQPLNVYYLLHENETDDSGRFSQASTSGTA